VAPPHGVTVPARSEGVLDPSSPLMSPPPSGVGPFTIAAMRKQEKKKNLDRVTSRLVDELHRRVKTYGEMWGGCSGHPDRDACDPFTRGRESAPRSNDRLVLEPVVVRYPPGGAFEVRTFAW